MMSSPLSRSRMERSVIRGKRRISLRFIRDRYSCGTASATLPSRRPCRSMTPTAAYGPPQRDHHETNCWGVADRGRVRVSGEGAGHDPRRLDHSGRGIEILDDAPAREVPEPWQGLQDRVVAVPGYDADGAGAD